MSETARRQKDVEHAYSVLQAQCTRWRELYPGQNYDDKEELEWLEEQIDEQTKAVKTNLDKFKKVREIYPFAAFNLFFPCSSLPPTAQFTSRIVMSASCQGLKSNCAIQRNSYEVEHLVSDNPAKVVLAG